ncbi:DNA-binding, integrase-type [Artemisia annua]|uniref:DNA-binding, integrase-type n=1 Tax=Artemisia annua TaxID=35608 RepID=A0A2U1P6P1_ARTAN|nr:DNA-binding, integrase-type [Artemisia annua]
MATTATTTTTTTTTTTADPDQPPPSPPHQPLLPSSIPIIDLRLLSQSDLYSLSTATSSSSSNNNHNRPDDVIIPKIDKTVFNESAGSRKQTYSRLRLAPPLSPHSANMRRHRQTLKYAPTAVSLPNDNIAVASENSNELAENSEIVSVLKGLFRSSLDENGDGEGDVIVEEGDVTVKESEVVENDVVMSPEPVTAVLPVEKEEEVKKKRGRPRKSESGNVDESAVLGSASVAKRVKAAEEEAVMSPEPVTAVLPEEEMMESTETKKKRGRPRKSEGGNGEGNEVLVSALSVAKRVRARARESSVMKVVEDYDRDKDKEVVNSRGEEVDVVKLGELDDPYGPEIGRRTEGMSSVDEFLEFFRGLNGQWGTTRKKRRVVDASEFGDCLPKGWRLSLCIKRKDGRVWVFCRRYISPSGRHFESCKDISAYLCSLLGKENMDKPSSTQSNVFVPVPDPVTESLNPEMIDAKNDSNVVIPVTVPTTESLNSEMINVKNDSNAIISVSVTEPGSSEMKRKRGRPRRLEDAENPVSVSVPSPAAKRMRESTIAKLLVYDSEMDLEIINCKGVKVDIVNLSRLEDPYSPEIRKRTEGMSTEDEMLGFLRGLNGQWGTTRKKRRVVDASDFGDTLPKDWKLILCVKKKQGHVWVSCHRYISPSGRQFKSCKDISMYLISLIGEENLDIPSRTQSNVVVPVPVPVPVTVPVADLLTVPATESVVTVPVTEPVVTVSATEPVATVPVTEPVVTVTATESVPVTEPVNSETIGVEKKSTAAVPVPVTEPCSSQMKPKRGRPRKNENGNAAVVRSPAVKQTRDNMVAKVMVYDNELDREIVNCRGVEVNIVNLSRLEDPYGPEIRRRSEGLSTEDELLGFLRGLNGQWGTTRKKRRVVDASDFGDALPKGWKLSLAIRKKGGLVWVFCRRYISPSGRQFESCKDISMYLLSLLRGENVDKPSGTHSNDCDDSALKAASGNAADLCVQEDPKRDSSAHIPSEPPISLPTECQKQVPVPVHAGEHYKCLKCFLIFDGKIDLLDHQALVHQDEQSHWSIVIGGFFECRFCYKTFYDMKQYNEHIGTHVTNDNKTSEAEKAHTAEKADDTASVSAEDVIRENHDARFDDEPISASPQSEHAMNYGAESKTDELVHDLNTNGDLFGEDSGDGIDNNYDVDDNEVPDVSASKSDFSLGHEASISITESNGRFESSGGTVAHKEFGGDRAVLEKDIVGIPNGQDAVSRSGFTQVNDKPEQERSSGNRPLSPFKNELMVGAGGVCKNVIGKSGSVEEPSHAVSESRIQTSSIYEEKGFRGNINDMHVHSSFGELTSEKEKVVNSESSSGVFHGRHGHDEKGFRGNINDMHVRSSFGELTSEKEKVVNSESSSGVFHGRHGHDEDRLADATKLPVKQNFSLFSPSSNTFKAVNSESMISSVKQEAPQKIGFASFNQAAQAPQKVGFASVNPVTQAPQKMGFASVNQVTQAPQKVGFASVNQVTQAPQKVGFASVNQIPHGFEQNRFSYGVASSKPDRQNEVRSSAFDSYNMSSTEGVTGVRKEDNYKSRSSVSPWHENEPVNKEKFHPANNVNNVPSNKLGEANIDNFQFYRNNGSINNQVASLGRNAGVIDFNTRKNLEFSSLVPPENDQAFSFQDDVGLYESAQQSSERGLLDHFSVAETSDEIFGNKIYSTPLDGINFDEDRGIGMHDLNLAFGNPHDLYADTTSVNQKKDGVNCSVVPPKTDVQTNLSMVNNSMVEDLKRGRESVSGSFSSSSNSQNRGFQHSGNNTGYPGRTWEDHRSDEYRSREDKKFMVGSGSSQRQPNEVVNRGMWNTGQGSQLQSGLANPHAQGHPHAQSQSPSSFHSFDIMSNKADDGVYRHGERYNDGSNVNGQRSGRSEPVEYRFIPGRGEHNPHALQGSNSRAFPYHTGLEQQTFDPNFWMGKNTMMPNMGGRNVVTICAWCRNEFQLPAIIHQQAQAGVGSLCPNCSAGFSGQANML